MLMRHRHCTAQFGKTPAPPACVPSTHCLEPTAHWYKQTSKDTVVAGLEYAGKTFGDSILLHSNDVCSTTAFEFKCDAPNSLTHNVSRQPRLGQEYVVMLNITQEYIPSCNMGQVCLWFPACSQHK